VRRGHDKSVDYWALGCLIYELLIGRTPFQDDNQAEIFKKIIHSQKSLSFPRGFDSEATDLVKKLLAPNPAFRLGQPLALRVPRPVLAED
jgi:serine/threonine protein kinase